MKRPRADNVPGMFKKYHYISRFPFTVWYQHAGDPCFVNGDFAVTLQVHLGESPNDSSAFHQENDFSKLDSSSERASLNVSGMAQA